MKERYIEDLKDIRNIMNRSSRFISLSGASGIAAGLIALAGAWLAYSMVYADKIGNGGRELFFSSQDRNTILLIGIGTMILAIGSVIIFTTRETRRNNEKIWDHHTRRLLVNLAIPLFAGGIVCLILLFRGMPGMIPPLTLVFYGLALVNASKYTLDEIRSLGILEIILGLISLYFIGYGLIFWSIGFGVLHIIYGFYMQVKKKS